MSYPTLPPTTFTQPSTHQGVKLSKLFKEARLLGCETFSRLVDAIVAVNWIKKITDIIVDMELEDNLKLKVATRLMDKSAVTCEKISNFVLLFLLLGSCLYVSLTTNITPVSTKIKNDKSFSDLDRLKSL